MTRQTAGELASKTMLVGRQDCLNKCWQFQEACRIAYTFYVEDPTCLPTFYVGNAACLPTFLEAVSPAVCEGLTPCELTAVMPLKMLVDRQVGKQDWLHKMWVGRQDRRNVGNPTCLQKLPTSGDLPAFLEAFSPPGLSPPLGPFSSPTFIPSRRILTLPVEGEGGKNLLPQNKAKMTTNKSE